ncbi:MAG TPA: GtrA family protein [Desulfuromonadales bacterium]|nr:GtrA family protein [Desulfuromonadales bacterium]
MKQRTARHRHSIVEFIKFACVGVLNTCIDVAIFFLLTWFGIPYVVAQGVSYSCGTGNSYLLNKFWTFHSSGLSYAEIFRFIVVNLVSLGISIAVLAILREKMGIGLAAAKGGATVCALAANFLGNKLWVFKKREVACDRSMVGNGRAELRTIPECEFSRCTSGGR